MIFKETCQQVLDGTKTQTRRPVKDGDVAVGTHSSINRVQGMSMPPKRLRIWDRWEVGKTYAVQPGRGKKAVGRIRITKIRRERLQEIGPDGLRAEGLQKDILDVWGTWRDRWVALWNSLYRKPYRWEDNPEVWVLEFELAEEEK